MAEQQLDVVVVASPENVYYASSALIFTQRTMPERLALLVLPRGAEPSFLVCHAEESIVRRDSWIADVRLYVEFQKSPMELLAETLCHRGLADSRIGIELRYLTVSFYEELRRLMPNVRFFTCDEMLDVVRSIKTPEEIEVLEKGTQKTEQAMWAAFQEAHPGVTEKSIGDAMACEVLRLGARQVAWMALGSGPNNLVAHHEPSDYRIERGEIIRVDFGAMFGGHFSDLQRTICVGKPDARHRDLYRRLRDVQRRTIDLMQPGTPVCDIYNFCKDAMERAGLTFRMVHIGHGIGIGSTEYPKINPHSQVRLQPGMVMCVEPAIVDVGRANYGLEDTVLITEHGPQLLSDLISTRDLWVVE